MEVVWKVEAAWRGVVGQLNPEQRCDETATAAVAWGGRQEVEEVYVLLAVLTWSEVAVVTTDGVMAA